MKTTSVEMSNIQGGLCRFFSIFKISLSFVCAQYNVLNILFRLFFKALIIFSLVVIMSDCQTIGTPRYLFKQQDEQMLLSDSPSPSK